MQRLAVFCGSRTGSRPEYATAAAALGTALARADIGLVFGGGHIGMMGVLADAVLAAGGTAIGVIPQALVDRELAHQGLTELKIVPDMHARKAVMAELSDGFIALPGAYGTADELFEILTWAQLGIHRKPIGLLDVGGFFAPLRDWLDRAVKEGFLKPKHRRLLLDAEIPEALLHLMRNFEPNDDAGKGLDRPRM